MIESTNFSTPTSRANATGAIASGHDLTSEAGIAMYDLGGNAFDAAISACFMACVCEPILASPGGGGFANIQTPNSNYILEFFVQTPLAKNESNRDFQEIQADFGTAKQTFHIGHASTATPGFIPGLLQLHNKHASLPLKTILRPAINAARNGIVVTAFQAFLSTVIEPILQHTYQAQKLFAPEGELIKQGQKFYNNDLADFFDRLSHNHTSQSLDSDTPNLLTPNQTGSHLTDQDFAIYQPIIRRPKNIDFNGAKISLNSLPAAGGALIAHAITQLNCSLNSSADTSVIEIANALAKVDKARTSAKGDIAKLAELLNPPAYRGTTHISAIDKDRNACSITLSNGEGNGHIVENCGFMLNNMLGEADVNPNGEINWPLNTRLSSMMCPTIATDTNGHLHVLGSGGSNRITSAIFQVLVNLLSRTQSPNEAIAQPRLHVTGGHLDFETQLDPSLNQTLQEQFPNHLRWEDPNMFFGGCHVVSLSPDGYFSGAGDPRRQGSFKSC